MNAYFCGRGCGYERENKLRKDCYFYQEDHDMGATITWCLLQSMLQKNDSLVYILRCPKTCAGYFDKSAVASIIYDRVIEDMPEHYDFRDDEAYDEDSAGPMGPTIRKLKDEIAKIQNARMEELADSIRENIMRVFYEQ